MRRKLSLVLWMLLLASARDAAPELQHTKNSHPAISKSEERTASQPNTVDCADFRPYATDPNHVWNRLYRRLFERRDAKGKAWGCDEVDPLLLRRSKHILEGPAYAETIRLLDEFINAHAESLIRDPLSRAIFQRDMWAVFNWLALPTDDHPREREELERRLAAIIKVVALTPSEIEHLPGNYAQLRGSATADGLALPDTAGDWMMIGRDDGTPAAEIHADYFPRSIFFVYLKPPSGPLNASKYLEFMRAYSKQRPPGDNCTFHACSPPQFPEGTELALVRRALLIDAAGRPVASPITESIQLRRYVKIPADTRVDFDRGTQQVAQFQLTRRGLLQGTIDLRRVGEEETGLSVFSTQGQDGFEDGWDGSQAGVILRGCHQCHQGTGVISFTSYSRVQFENDHLFVLVHNSSEIEETKVAIKFLRKGEAWKQLTRLLHAGGYRFFPLW
ncbi:MAG TPA: hypothetical protein VKZ53_23260 [Candidatus Angelobacter sp.]|nr:hypothetical protein [Candidatus Angelobacter sp.]